MSTLFIMRRAKIVSITKHDFLHDFKEVTYENIAGYKLPCFFHFQNLFNITEMNKFIIRINMVKNNFVSLS